MHLSKSNGSIVWRILSVLVVLLIVGLLLLIYCSSLAVEEKLLRIEQCFSKGQVVTAIVSQPQQISRQQYKNNILVDDPYLNDYLPSQRRGIEPQGEYRYAFLGNPQALAPLTAWAHENEWQSLCQGSVGQYKTGSFDAFSPDLAEHVELKDSDNEEGAEYWVTLREGLSWQPLKEACFSNLAPLSPHFLKKHPVTAHDFLFFWKVISNQLIDDQSVVSLRVVYAPFESLTVINDRTFVLKVRKVRTADGELAIPYTALQRVMGFRPLPAWLYLHEANGEKIVPLEKVDTSSQFAKSYMVHFARSYIASCGPWIFEGLTQEGIQFSRNPEYYNPYVANWERLRVNFYGTFDAIYRDFQQKNLDICQVPRDKITALEAWMEAGMEKKPLYLLRDQEPSYYYLGLNCSHKILQSKQVRQAIDFAVDKQRIIAQVLQGHAMALSGPYICTSTNMNPKVLPRAYNPIEAMRILREEGWEDRDRDGVLEKEIDGVVTPLQFSMIYYADNSVAKQVCELIAVQLKQIGINALLRGVKISDLSTAFDDKSFEALFLGWMIAPPPEDFEGQWHSKYAEMKGSFNAVKFKDEQVDKILDQLIWEAHPDKRLKLYHALHERIADTTPYLFLFSDIRTYAVWNWVENVFIPRQRQDLFPGSRDPMPRIYYSWDNSKRRQE